jgi:hypothetical protein
MTDDIQPAIRTKELRLVDDDGQDRAVLSTDEKGTFLSFVDESHNGRTRLGLTQAGLATLVLARADGQQNFSISVEPEGRVILEGYDNSGIERFRLELKSNGSHTELSFHEKQRKPRMVLMAEDKGPAGLFILDQHGKALFSTTP